MKIQKAIHLLLLGLSSVLFCQSYAQTEKNNSPETKKSEHSHVRLDSSKTMRIEYAYPSWNTDSKSIDTAYMILVDTNSKHVVQIQVQETEPDSGIFSGYFSINWANGAEIKPEIYIPPQDLFVSAEGINKATTLIKSGQLKRKPFVFIEDERKIQMIDVYDTKEQALRAFDAYQEKLRIKNEALKPQPTPIPDASKLEAARLAAIQAEKEKLAREAADREAERIRLEQLEQRKAEERRKQQEALAVAEKVKRKADAVKLAEDAMKLYKSGDYAKAEEQFNKSIELDPENSTYYFQYGVVLYKTGKYNKSLVYLKMAEGPGVNQLEKYYYMGLVHMRLKEYPEAIKAFNEVKKSKDPTMAPSAAFYSGLVYFGEEKLEEAKNEFQYVLDTSQDPKMDEQAETYIERVSNLQRFREAQKTKFILTGMYGISYDSNVLSSPDQLLSSQTATDVAGFRNMFSVGLEYRPVYTENHEFSTKLNILDMYTFNDKFSPSSDLQAADPLVTTITAPYRYKGQLFGKGFQLEAAPGYEVLNMDMNKDSKQETIMRSTFINLSNLFVMSQDRFDTYKIGYRSDTSLVDATPDEDLSGSKINLAYNIMYFLNKKKTQAYIGDAGYTIQSAGKNQANNKIDLAFAYNAPWYSDMAWNARLALYYINYYNNSDSRKDTNYSLNWGFSKPHTQWMQSAVTVNYTKNSSNLSSSTYSKYSLMYNLIFNTSF